MAKNVKLSADTIGDALDKLRGAVMIVYPMGLPPYDEVQQILDDNEQLEGRQAAKEIIPAGDMQVWWAGKELQRGKALQDYIGRNEKTKIVCKIQKVRDEGRLGDGRKLLAASSGLKLRLLVEYKKGRGGGVPRRANGAGHIDEHDVSRSVSFSLRSVEAAHLPVSRCMMNRRKRK